MSETSTQSDRDQRSGRFLSGCKPGPGRQRGSRNRLADSFLLDLAACWEKHGVEALERCATDTPEVLVKVIASLLPKSVDLNMTLDATGFASKLQQAAALLGVDLEPPRQPRRRLPGQPVHLIDHRK